MKHKENTNERTYVHRESTKSNFVSGTTNKSIADVAVCVCDCDCVCVWSVLVRMCGVVGEGVVELVFALRDELRTDKGNMKALTSKTPHSDNNV